MSLALRGLRISDDIASVCLVHAATLTKLDVSECEHDVTDVTAAEVAKCTRLTELQLQGCNRITPRALLCIVQACTRLVIVGLSGCNVTDEALAYLLAAKGARPASYVHTLLAGGCNLLTNACVPFFRASPQLRILKLGRSEFVTASVAVGIAQLSRQLQVFDVSKSPNLPKRSAAAKLSQEEPMVDAYEQMLADLTDLLPSATICC